MGKMETVAMKEKRVKYDKQTKAINFRALAQKFQLKDLESKVTISRRIIDMVTFDSRSLS